ncbi:MAG: flavodoxin family protein [Spirochaetia bacterium]|jgi:flavodoxin
MKVLLVVSSFHHRNTEKIAGVFAWIFDARMKTPSQTEKGELEDCDLIGFGSGIDSGRHYKELLDFADSLTRVADRKAFIFSTCGMPVSVAGRNFVTDYATKSHSALREKLTSRGYAVIGEFSCAGHNTNSFLKLFGGLNKGRPNAEDLGDAEVFARALKENLESGKPR